MASRAIVNFNELPVTFVIRGGRWTRKRSFAVRFDITRNAICAKIPLENSFKLLQHSEEIHEGEAKSSYPSRNAQKPFIRVIKTGDEPGNSPTQATSKAKRVKKNKKRSHKNGSKRDGSFRLLANSATLELGKKTLNEAVRDLFTLKKPAIVSQANPQTLFHVGSIPVLRKRVEEVNMISYAEEAPPKTSKVKIIKTKKSKKAKSLTLQSETPRAYSGAITRSRSIEMSYADMVSQPPPSPSQDAPSIEKATNTLSHEELDPLFREEDFPYVFIGSGSTSTDSHKESENMPVLVTGIAEIEEQLQEMQRRLDEKDAQITTLFAQHSHS